MSAEASGGGMDGDDDKKRKRDAIEDAVNQLALSESSNTDDTDEESAATDEKEKGLSPHCPGKSKSFSNLTNLRNTKTEEIAKKEHITNKKRRIEIANEIRAAEGRDQPMVEAPHEEETGSSHGGGGDCKKPTEEDDGKKSKSGASGSQSDDSMPEADAKDDAVEEMADVSKK